MTLVLPLPPSVNEYWLYSRRGVRISDHGKAFRRDVAFYVRLRQIKKLTDRLRVTVFLHPPDRRRRDLDNVLKALLDGMQHAGVYKDDGQIDELSVHRGALVEHGKVVVTVEAIG